jgi:hypothetical protein
MFDEAVSVSHGSGALLATQKGITLPPLQTLKVRSGYMLMAAIGRYRHMAKSGAVGTEYRNTLGKMTRLITKQGVDLPSVMRSTIRELSQHGISTVSYASGRVMRMDSAVRRDLVSEFTSIIQDIQKQVATEIGADGWEISAHEHPAEDHEDAQGHVFTDIEFEKLQNLETGFDIDGASHHLEGRPIGMWNCRHIAYPFVIGVSQRTHSPEALQQIKERNQQGVTWNGRKMTLYQAEQMQRKLENAMRRERENMNLLAAVKDTDPKMLSEWRKSKGKLAGLRREYGDLGKTLKPHGLRMKWERAYVTKGTIGSAKMSSSKIGANFQEPFFTNNEGADATNQFIQGDNLSETLHNVETKIKDLSNREDGVIIDRNGRIIHVERGGEHSVNPPAALIKDNIFTHNHPSGGAALSFDDIQSIINDDGFAVRAVTSDGRFVDFRKGSGALDKGIIDAMKNERFNSNAQLFLKAQRKAWEIHGRNATNQQVFTVAENLINEWLIDNAHKFGYVFTQGRI